MSHAKAQRRKGKAERRKPAIRTAAQRGAQEYEAEVNVAIAKIEAASHFIEQVQRRIDELGGLHYRAIAVEQDNNLAWFWIRRHAEYDKILGSK